MLHDRPACPSGLLVLDAKRKGLEVMRARGATYVGEGDRVVVRLGDRSGEIQPATPRTPVKARVELTVLGTPLRIEGGRVRFRLGRPDTRKGLPMTVKANAQIIVVS